jgi:hypothetical protein
MWKSFIEHRRFVLFRTHWQFCGLQWIGTCIIGLSGTLLLTNHLTTSKWILTWPQFTIIGKTGLSSYLRWYEKGGHCWLHPSVGSNGWVRLTKMKLQNNDDVRIIFSIHAIEASFIRHMTFEEIAAYMIEPNEKRMSSCNCVAS